MSTRKFPPGEEIRKLRKSKKLSQTAFGAIASISFRAVSLIETNRQKPSAGTLLLWAEEFNVNFGLGWVKEHLEKKGQVKKQRETLQKEDVGEIWPVRIPFVGLVPAGQGIEPIDIGEEMYVLDADIKGIRNPRALRVVGDSMQDSNVEDGDTIIIGDCDTPNNRIVVAIIEGKADVTVTLKKWKEKGDKVILVPANLRYKPETYDRDKVHCHGAVRKVIRTID